jgi:hypothetical protein
LTSGCATFNRLGPASSAIHAATASSEDLKAVGPAQKGCELEQRTYLFVSSLPPVSAWVEVNNVWINYLEKKLPGSTKSAQKDISPCVRSPYGKGT